MDYPYYSHYNPLFGLVYNNDLNGVKAMIQKGHPMNEIGRLNGKALHYAKTVEMVKLLVEKGANVTEEDTFGQTHLHNAANRKTFEIIKLLIESGCDVNAKNNRGQTALHCAANRGDVKLVKLLIDSGANVNAKDIDGYTPLHHVYCVPRVEVVKFLIESGADVNARNWKGQMPLDFEIVKRVVKPMRFLAIKEELMAAAWHPKRVERWLEHGHEVLDMMLGY